MIPIRFFHIEDNYNNIWRNFVFRCFHSSNTLDIIMFCRSCSGYAYCLIFF
eukprot:UN09184